MKPLCAHRATSAMIKAWTSLVVNRFVSTDVGGRDKSQVKTPTLQEPLAHLSKRRGARLIPAGQCSAHVWLPRASGSGGGDSSILAPAAISISVPSLEQHSLAEYSGV